MRSLRTTIVSHICGSPPKQIRYWARSQSNLSVHNHIHVTVITSQFEKFHNALVLRPTLTVSVALQIGLLTQTSNVGNGAGGAGREARLPTKLLGFPEQLILHNLVAGIDYRRSVQLVPEPLPSWSLGPIPDEKERKKIDQPIHQPIPLPQPHTGRPPTHFRYFYSHWFYNFASIPIHIPF